MIIDLHCHSHFSDGALSPESLLAKALEAKIQILALTDHDTLDGLEPLKRAAQNQNINIINGIELSTRWKKYDIHIIGLQVDEQNEHLHALIERQNENRIIRAKRIAEKLQLLGINDAYEKACVYAGHKRVGRPHFAKLLMEEKYVTTMQLAFKRYLGKGKPAYVETPWISVAEAVEGIQQAKGQSVLAHPLKYKLTRTKLYELTQDFKEAGGVGVEVVSGDMTTGEIQEMAGLSMRYQLLASSGSDYHSEFASRISLGRQKQIPVNCSAIWEQWGEK